MSISTWLFFYYGIGGNNWIYKSRKNIKGLYDNKYSVKNYIINKKLEKNGKDTWLRLNSKWYDLSNAIAAKATDGG